MTWSDFIRLNTTEAEHMLYATRLANDMVLALIFDAETPFSTIRTQANQLVHSLSASPTERQTAPINEEDGDDEAPWPPSRIFSRTSLLPIRNRANVAIRRDPGKNPARPIPLSFGKSLRFSRDSSPAIPLQSAFHTGDLPRQTLPDLDKTVESAAINS